MLLWPFKFKFLNVKCLYKVVPARVVSHSAKMKNNKQRDGLFLFNACVWLEML